MKSFKFTALLLLLVLSHASAEEEEGADKSREKRQQIAFYPRRGPRPPPYAVQMEPIVQYSQRDPLYNPLASAKSDDSLYNNEDLQGYYNEPEPIIEIIIKESNESLPTPAPPPPQPQPRPTKEPVQVFYVKYEKKQGHGDEKPRVVYDTPIPALNPVEEHEESEPERAYQDEGPVLTSPAPPLEPSTTLRTVIRPDSEVYHAGSSGIRVTFGTEQVPPNQHNKRSDRVAAGSPKRQHGPYQPLQPVGHPGHRFPPALAQQRVVNSFPNQQQIGPTFPPQFQQPQIPLRNPNSVGRPQRLPITIQGLPEVQQRVPFNSFNNRGNVNQQTPATRPFNFGPTQSSTIPVNGFVDHQQQEIEKQRYYEQRRQQDLIRQQEAHRQQQLQIQQQRQQEQLRIQEQQYRQQQAKYNQQQLQYQQSQQAAAAAERPGGEILKAVPKLEQHYAIRENPLHPGPFPPNPQHVQLPGITQPQFAQRSPVVADHFQRNRQAQYVPEDNSQQKFFSPQQQQSVWGTSRPVFNNPGQKIYATPVSNSVDLQTPSSTTQRPTTAVPTTPSPPSTTETTSTTVSPKSKEKIQQNIANLPDEVPDDIRQQLLSSGILGNADIQILDYDKVGDIPIENLPPEALANFYGAGGGAATAASEPVPSVVEGPKVEQATLRPGGVEMKVVHFDPNTAQGQAIAEQHIREDATRLDPVKIGPKDSSRYNRYLPLKVSGAAFPLPDVPELNGRRITSVVVLAPVDYNFHGDGGEAQSQAQEEHSQRVNGSRGARKLNDVQAVKFLAGDALKQVVKKPNAENYKKWLEQESRADPQRQSVVLLVTTPVDDTRGEKEIFMYDVTTQAVSKLAGDLSTAFVDVAESNSDNEDAKTDILQ